MKRLLVALTALTLILGVTGAAMAGPNSGGGKKENPNSGPQEPGCKPSDEQPKKCDPPACPSGDTDGDGICNDVDNCPDDANPGQEDTYGDARGDACEPVTDPCDGLGGDTDGDGVCDDDDNCRDDANPGQEDADENGVGDACEPGGDDPCSTGGLAETGLGGKTIAQEAWDQGLSALPILEDPNHDGEVSGPMWDGSSQADALPPLGAVLRELACAIDLLIPAPPSPADL